MRKTTFKLASIALTLTMAFSAYAQQPLRVAADPVPHAEILNFIAKQHPENKLKVIELSNGVNANELLVNGDVDANYFQHRPYLLDQQKQLGKELVVVATVHIEPFGIYSAKHRSLQDIPEGATIAIPNNVTNLSRGLYLLQANNIIKLKPEFTQGETKLATPADIASNPKKVKILEVEAPQIPRSLEDVDFGVINGNYALEAGLVPAKDALALESDKNNPYANLLVTTPALANDPRIKALAKDLESKSTADFINKQYQGSVIPVEHNP